MLEDSNKNGNGTIATSSLPLCFPLSPLQLKCKESDLRHHQQNSFGQNLPFNLASIAKKDESLG